MSELERRAHWAPEQIGRERRGDVVPLVTPRWVIIGWDEADGRYAIMASDQLDEATLNGQRRWMRPDPTADPFGWGYSMDIGPMDYVVHLTIGRHRSSGEFAFWVIVTASYAECLAALARSWNPDA